MFSAFSSSVTRESREHHQSRAQTEFPLISRIFTEERSRILNNQIATLTILFHEKKVRLQSSREIYPNPETLQTPGDQPPSRLSYSSRFLLGKILPGCGCYLSTFHRSPSVRFVDLLTREATQCLFPLFVLLCLGLARIGLCVVGEGGLINGG